MNTDSTPEATFEQRHYDLCRFLEVEDRFPTAEDDPALAAWMDECRALYAKGKLDKLDAGRLTFLRGWEWDARKARFQVKLDAFSEYFRKNGEAPSQIHPTEFKLGRWVGSMITRYKKNELADWQIARLESTPGWAWDLREARFLRRVRDLKQHFYTFGDLRVKFLAPELVSWINNRRAEYKQGKLSEAQVRLIESIPEWSWGRPAKEVSQ